MKQDSSLVAGSATGITKSITHKDIMSAIKTKTSAGKLNVQKNYLNNDNHPPKHRRYTKKTQKINTLYVGPCTTKETPNAMIVITNVITTLSNGTETIEQKAKCVDVKDPSKFVFKSVVPECKGSKDTHM